MTAHETWKPVPGWAGLYDVSSLGSVRSLPRYTPASPGMRGGRVLVPEVRPSGACVVKLSDGPRRRSVSVDTLMAEAGFAVARRPRAAFGRYRVTGGGGVWQVLRMPPYGAVLATVATRAEAEALAGHCDTAWRRGTARPDTLPGQWLNSGSNYTVRGVGRRWRVCLGGETLTGLSYLTFEDAHNVMVLLNDERQLGTKGRG